MLAEIFEKDELELKEDEPTTQEIKEPLPKVREVIPHIKNVETNTNVGQTLENARPLKEFDQLDWIPIDFSHLLSNTRNEKY